MAKSKSTTGADPSVIRFRCTQCGTTLKVSVRQANKYIDCPKCKNRTNVPSSQKQADDDAKDYDVNKLAYDTTGTCRNCGAKMVKKAVVCVSCGFDYRSGRELELVDKTKLPVDYPYWKKIWSSLGAKEITTGLTQVMGAFSVPAIAGLLLFAVAWGLAWYFTSDDKGVPSWPYYAGLALFAVAVLGCLGMIQQALVETCGRGLYGRAISAGAVPAALLYFLVNFLIAFAIPLLLIGVVGLSYSVPEKELLADKSTLDGFPMVHVEISILAVVIIGVLLLPFSTFYFFYSLGAFATDLTVNPLRVFEWIAKSPLDAGHWFLLSLPLLISGTLLPFGIGLLVQIGMGGEMGFDKFTMVSWIFVVMSMAVLLSYCVSALAYTVGLVFKRNL